MLHLSVDGPNWSLAVKRFAIGCEKKHYSACHRSGGCLAVEIIRLCFLLFGGIRKLFSVGQSQIEIKKIDN
jgi:hypothetical protein